jgi:hypothetical protein
MVMPKKETQWFNAEAALSLRTLKAVPIWLVFSHFVGSNQNAPEESTGQQKDQKETTNHEEHSSETP